MENDKRKRARKQPSRTPAKTPVTHRLKESEEDSASFLNKIILGSSIALLLTILLASSFKISPDTYKVGDIAVKNVKAPEDNLIQDVQATRKRTNDARKTAQVVFDWDDNVLIDISSRVRDAFSSARSIRRQSILEPGEIPAKPETATKGRTPLNRPREVGEASQTPFGDDPETAAAEIKSMKSAAFQERLGVDVNDELFLLLEAENYSSETGELVIKMMEAALNKGLVGDDREYMLASNGGVLIRDLGTGRETRLTDIGEVLYKSDMETFLRDTVENLAPENLAGSKEIALRLAPKLLRPNLSMNRVETQARVERVVKEVKPVYFQVKKGEMILRQGDPITEEKLMKLRGLAAAMEPSKVVYIWLGLLVLVVSILYLGWIYLHKFKHWVLRANKQLILLSALFVGNMLLVKAALYVSSAMADNQGMIEAVSFYYAVPFAAGALLAVILFDMEIAILFSVATFILVGVLIKDNISFSLVALIGSLVVSFRGKHYRQRSSLLVTGVFIGLGNLAIIVSADLINFSLFTTQGLFDGIMGFLGGIITAVIVSGILPIFESLFNLTSDIKLLELSDLNHPLLRELVVQAPGTYHHSVIVGNLAEEAAKNIEANSLFARVSSYYHDVGKINKPEYFIENQQSSLNRHDKLSPSMSSLILMAHVKEGVDLARGHKLSQAIIDIINQHHGTSIISYFYNKAKELNNQGHQHINEEDFRYHGPKPQSKEAAIVLLADSVEAASRSLDEPTPARLRNLVQRIVNHHFLDGQLDKCNLSLKDLNTIVESFVRILAAMFHNRIPYPDQEDELEEIPQSAPDLDFGGKPTKPATGKAGADKR